MLACWRTEAPACDGSLGDGVLVGRNRRIFAHLAASFGAIQCLGGEALIISAGLWRWIAIRQTFVVRPLFRPRRDDNRGTSPCAVHCAAASAAQSGGRSPALGSFSRNGGATRPIARWCRNELKRSRPAARTVHESAWASACRDGAICPRVWRPPGDPDSETAVGSSPPAQRWACRRKQLASVEQGPRSRGLVASIRVTRHAGTGPAS